MKTITTILNFLILTIMVTAQPLFLEQVSGVSTGLNYVIPTGWSGANVVSVWICGDSGVVLKTTTSGGAWQNVSVPSTLNLNTITYNRDNSIMALTAGVRNDTAVVYRTTNSGTNWSIVFRQYQGNINAMYFTNSTGLMIGNPVGGRWSIWRITAQGTVFDSTNMYLPRNGTEIGYRNSFNMCNGSLYTFFGTNNYRVYYSTNMGNNWLVMPVPAQQNIKSIHFPQCFNISNLVGYLGCDTKVLYTSNSGLNWIETIPVPGTGLINSLVACPYPVETSIGMYDVMITKGDNTLYRIPYNTWMPAYTAPSGNYRYISQLLQGWYTYAVRDNGGISWGSCGMGSIRRLSEIIPIDYTLAQNYPNPFNPVTRIKFDVPVKSDIRISVFDVLGKEVVRLVDQNVLAGQYEVEWDASEMTSGLYFYSFISEKFVQTKKMILVK